MSIFAWKTVDMPGVPRNLIEHSLNVSKTARPIKQKLRRFARDKKEAIRIEITRLLAAGFIKEVYHPDWLANPVLVRKKNNEWRMCVVYLFLEMLEFWRILSLKIFKMLHDEFLYDESLNSYHSHIYMLARL